MTGQKDLFLSEQLALKVLVKKAAQLRRLMQDLARLVELVKVTLEVETEVAVEIAVGVPQDLAGLGTEKGPGG
jgi:hypothetical protein